MKYVNAKSIFPKELLREIQKYANGKMVYIPILKGAQKKWGEVSGSKDFLDYRNKEIRQQFLIGVTIDQLSNQYFLSHDSIKKIVYSKK
ncbi:CD3324 family protein [Sporosarcina sp. USHLN248]|uniref:CD3324 family protein n=1 Tax=Sporosarcina sp. USHLN248 TaxID=3081300 RepID=UPI00301713F9